MRSRLSSGTTLITAVLLVMLPALAVLQYRWVGQVSDAERERMRTNLRIAAAQFREAFDGEVVRAALGLQVGASLSRDPAGGERYAAQYDGWQTTASDPQILSRLFVVDADAGQLRLRRWNPDGRTFEAAAWPAALAQLRPEFERDREALARGEFPRRFPVRSEGSIIALPFRMPGPPPGFRPEAAPSGQIFGFTVLELDIDYIRQQMLPALTQRHFVHPDGDRYRVAVISSNEPLHVVYRSDPDATVDPAMADASVVLLGRPEPEFFMPRRGGGGRGMGRSNMVIEPGPQGRDGRRVRERREETGQWRLLVQHQSGSLDAAVAAVRRRNLGISAGVLLLLTVSIGLLTANARKAHRLARQQVEFVAGVSHELRTPVAVIRSAAENLEQGVVTGERVRQYGTAIGLEARRLGDMVERVLQYSGIESGLTSEQRVPLSAAELVDIALASAAPLVATAGVTVQRELADDLPLVSGDGPALRSAIENLIGNALKYGGADRFVGVSVRAVPLRGRTEVHITVSDHGNGIPAAELPHIFEPFYRGAEATARQVHGNGLGLSLVKRIVEAHGGHVAVDTREGAGTAFTISLPALPPDDRAHRVTGAAHPAHS